MNEAQGQIDTERVFINSPSQSLPLNRNSQPPISLATPQEDDSEFFVLEPARTLYVEPEGFEVEKLTTHPYYCTEKRVINNKQVKIKSNQFLLVWTFKKEEGKWGEYVPDQTQHAYSQQSMDEWNRFSKKVIGLMEEEKDLFQLKTFFGYYCEFLRDIYPALLTAWLFGGLIYISQIIMASIKMNLILWKSLSWILICFFLLPQLILVCFLIEYPWGMIRHRANKLKRIVKEANDKFRQDKKKAFLSTFGTYLIMVTSDKVESWSEALEQGNGDASNSRGDETGNANPENSTQEDNNSLPNRQLPLRDRERISTREETFREEDIKTQLRSDSPLLK